MSIVKFHGLTAFSALTTPDDALSAFETFSDGYDVNLWRIFGMWSQGVDPRTWGGPAAYGNKIRSALSRQVDQGRYTMFTFSTDQIPGSPIYLSESDWLSYASAARDACLDFAGFIFWETENEYGAGKNGQRTKLLTPDFFTGLPLWSSSSVDGAPSTDAFGPFGTIGSLHTTRDWQYARHAKDAYDLSRGNPVPIVSHAPTLLAEPDQFRRLTPRQVSDYAALSDLMGCGVVMHDLDFEFCRVPTDPNVLACCEATKEIWSLGIDPTLAASGRYTRGPQAECPFSHTDRYDDEAPTPVEVDPTGTLRTFALDNGSMGVVVLVDHGPKYNKGPQGGWRETDRLGTFQNVRLVSR